MDFSGWVGAHLAWGASSGTGVVPSLDLSGCMHLSNFFFSCFPLASLVASHQVALQRHANIMWKFTTVCSAVQQTNSCAGGDYYNEYSARMSMLGEPYRMSHLTVAFSPPGLDTCGGSGAVVAAYVVAACVSAWCVAARTAITMLGHVIGLDCGPESRVAARTAITMLGQVVAA